MMDYFDAWMDIFRQEFGHEPTNRELALVLQSLLETKELTR